MSSDMKLKLYYFDIAGKAEAIRLALKYADIDFEDYKFKDGEFAEMKASGKLQFGQCPALEVTNHGKTTILTQSGAILRFIARIAPNSGLMPRCPVQACQVDALVDQEADAFQSARCIIYRSRFGIDIDEATAQKCKDKINDEVIPVHFAKLEKIIELGGTEWMAGTDKPSIADFQWAGILPAVRQGWTGRGSVFDSEKYPKLANMLKKFEELPAVVEWYKNNEYKLWFQPC